VNGSCKQEVKVDEVERTREALKTLFDTQQFAVLATHDEGQPYVSLMAFAATDDLKCLVLATERDTQKYANLVSNPRAALLIDNRSNRISDTQQAIAVTALGEIRELNKRQHLSTFLKKHPHLEAFVKPPSCALLGMQVLKYVVVEGLQDVKELYP
jgi:nitroimidazol reductase NimA-like FMN-containing flavoprotein (pyridoxamine 5'-phosphate oxidase superfamily)